jgi:hypothetical protein
MVECMEALRHRIALYRQYLREGASADRGVDYVRQIKADEAELAAIKQRLGTEGSDVSDLCRQ